MQVHCADCYCYRIKEKSSISTSLANGMLHPHFLLSRSNSDLGIAVQQQIVSSLLRITHRCKSTLDTSTRMDTSFLDNRPHMLSADLCGQGARVMTL